MISIEQFISNWNKITTNYYNPKKIIEIKYYSRTRLSFKLYLLRKDYLLDNNFKEFFRDKNNSGRLGNTFKKLTDLYRYTPEKGSNFKGLFNPDNWRRYEKDYIEYEYFMFKN